MGIDYGVCKRETLRENSKEKKKLKLLHERSEKESFYIVTWNKIVAKFWNSKTFDNKKLSIIKGYIIELIYIISLDKKKFMFHCMIKLGKLGFGS